MLVLRFDCRNSREPFSREYPRGHGIGGDFRGALVHRFPYVIVFTNDCGIPTIFGLRHAASDRRDWFSRTMQ